MTDRPARRVAFIVPYGEASESYLPDTLLSWLSARARRHGHATKVVRVYYDGHDATRDERVRQMLMATLEGFAPTDLVLERVFDRAPLLALRSQHGAKLVMVCRGDGFDPDPHFDGWIGRSPGLHRGRTRRSPTIGDLVRGFDAWLGDEGDDATALPPVELDLAHDVIALDDPERLRTPRLRTVFGNAGCPYAADPRASAHYVGLSEALLPLVGSDTAGDALSLLGCAFCPMGGDYQRTEPSAIVAWIAAQAIAIRAAAPATEGFVLSDQAPLTYLGALFEATRALAPVRWLVAMRADVLVREQARLERTIALAAQAGQTLSLYLTGFESFSDRELDRYVKGTRATVLLEAIAVMRRLSHAHGESFGHALDRGHSLILWSPWTGLEDLDESLTAIRQHGLTELFKDLGRNRLRLTHEVPITLAAQRDGAIVTHWPDGDEGAARAKGYSTERPWRFLDADTALAHALAEALRMRLGRDTELAQLRGAVAHARGRGQACLERPDGVAAAREQVLTDVTTLEQALARWLGAERPRIAGTPPRGRFMRADVIDVGAPCDCGRPWCAERDRFLEPREADARLARAIKETEGALVLAGGEVLAHPDLEALLERAARSTRPIGLALVRPPALDADLDAFARTELHLTALSLDVTTLAELEAYGAAPLPEADVRELRLLPCAASLVRWRADPTELEAIMTMASRSLGADVLRVVFALDAVGLAHLDDAAEMLETLATCAARQRLAFEVSPLSAGPTWRARMALPALAGTSRSHVAQSR